MWCGLCLTNTKRIVYGFLLNAVNSDNGGMGDGESTTSKTESTSSSDGGGGGGNPVVTEGSSGDGGGVSGGVVAGVVVVLLVVVGVLAVAAGLVGWVLYRRKRLGQQLLTSGTLNNIGMLIRCQKNCVAAKPYTIPFNAYTLINNRQ